MKLIDKVALKGSMTAVLRRRDGSFETTHKDNIIVDPGFDFIADAIGARTSRPAVMSHIGLGSGTTAPAPDQTALATQIARAAATYGHTAGTKLFTMTSMFPEGQATGAITEAGVFNAAIGGTMLDRVVFPVINKGADDTLEMIFKFTLTQPGPDLP